jgi:hypothetical protein
MTNSMRQYCLGCKQLSQFTEKIDCIVMFFMSMAPYNSESNAGVGSRDSNYTRRCGDRLQLQATLPRLKQAPSQPPLLLNKVTHSSRLQSSLFLLRVDMHLVIMLSQTNASRKRCTTAWLNTCTRFSPVCVRT